MAKIASVVETLDDVPENLRELYMEADGKFRLDAEGVEDVSGLKSTLEKLKRESKDARDALKKYDGFDPEEYQRLKEAADNAEQTKLQTEGKWEEMKDRLTKTFEKERATLSGELSKRDQFIERLLIENELNGAIERAGVLPEHRKAVRAMLREAGPKVVADGDEYRGLLGDVSIAEYVESWAKTEEAAYYLPAEGKGGSGARDSKGGGGGGRKPYKEMGEQDKIDFIDKHGKDEFIKHMMATK